MIDYFALALTHGLILIALIRILGRDELDREDVQSLAEADADEALLMDAAPEQAADRQPKRGRRT